MADFLAKFAVVCSTYVSTILLLTGVTTAILSAVILKIYGLLLRQENWARYFGWAYGVFGVQHLVQALCSWAESRSLSGENWESIRTVAHTLGSTASTLLVLAAALALLGKIKSFKHLPNWAWAATFFAVLVEIYDPSTWYLRIPNAGFSAVCLTLLGWALYINFEQKNPNFALVNLVGAGLYAVLHLIYILNPWIAESTLWPDLSREISGANLVEARLGALDALTFAFGFLFKLGLFLGGLLLEIGMLLLLSPSAARGFQGDLTQKRKPFENEEIARALGESVEADLAVLWIRCPGDREGDLRYQVWSRSGDALRVSQEPAKEVIFRTGKEHIVPLSGKGAAPALAIVPMRFHGAVIGCLHLEWRRRPGYTSTALQRVRQLADWLAPLVHKFRQLIAVDRVSNDLHSVEEIASRLKSPKEALENLVPVIHRSLLPHATGCMINLGFVRAWAVCNDETLDAGHGDLKDEEQLHQKVLSLAGADAESFELSPVDLIVSGVKVGHIVFAISKDRDPLTRPALTADRIHLQTIASLLADVFLDTAYVQFAAALTDLQVKLNLTAGNSVESWFGTTEAAARAVGLAWVTASLPDGEGRRFYSNQEDVGLVRDLASALSDSAWAHGPIIPLPLPEAFKGAHHVVVLRLHDSGAHLWLGIGRKTFGRELEFSSPWRDFFESLAQTTDSALVRIERQRLQLEAKQLESDRYRLQHEARQMENFTTRVETTGLLMHTLGNDATALLQGTERLVEMLPERGQPVTDELRHKALSLKESAQNFQSLAMAFKQPVPTDTRSRIFLMDAVNKIIMLHRDSFHAKGVHLEVSIAPDLEIRVPLDITYIALVTLVVNSSEAIGRDGGTIKISATNEGECVICNIEDTGRGINPDIAEHLFEPGYSTKASGTGLGLWLARKSLRRYNSDLRVTSCQPGATKFTLYFSS